MMTEKISGFFDCRVYDKRLERAARKLKADTENVTFTATFDAAMLPKEFAGDEFAKAYTSKDGTPRVAVSFKIGANCRWYDKAGQPCARPQNSELDGERYDVQIEYTKKAKNPADDKAPCGFWANAIMYRKTAANPFAEPFDESTAEAEAIPTQVENTPQAEQAENPSNDLPF